MEFCCISDTHNQHCKIDVPDCDMVIHAGDCTSRGTEAEILDFLDWYGDLPHQHKVLIAGNHDFGFESNPIKYAVECGNRGITYLQDESIVIDGIKIHGSPMQPEFCDWAFNCWRTEAEEVRNALHGFDYPFIGKFWDMIENDTDIVVTHGPPKHILDACGNGHVGCELLAQHMQRVKPKFHVFGHIHEGAGDMHFAGTDYLNASSLDGRYKPIGHEIKIWEIK